MTVKGERCRHLTQKAVWFRRAAGAQCPPGRMNAASFVISMPRAQSFTYPMRNFKKLWRIANI